MRAGVRRSEQRCYLAVLGAISLESFVKCLPFFVPAVPAWFLNFSPPSVVHVSAIGSQAMELGTTGYPNTRYSRRQYTVNLGREGRSAGVIRRNRPRPSNSLL